MLTRDEMNRMVEEKGDVATAESMAVDLVDQTLGMLNTFVEMNPGYRHPSVAIPYAMELLMIMVTETAPQRDWEGLGEALQEQIADSVRRALEVPENSDQEPDDLVEPQNG